MTVIVRRICEDEAETFRRVRLAALSDSPAAFGSTFEREERLTATDWEERARRSATGDDRSTFFALDGANIVGLVGGYRPEDDRKSIELVSMWTDPSVRRSGVGRLLVEAVVGWARSLGAERVDLWVARGNTAAENLYRAMGFAETGDYQPLPSDPCREELRMRLAIT